MNILKVNLALYFVCLVVQKMDCRAFKYIAGFAWFGTLVFFDCPAIFVICHESWQIIVNICANWSSIPLFL